MLAEAGSVAGRDCRMLLLGQRRSAVASAAVGFVVNAVCRASRDYSP